MDFLLAAVLLLQPANEIVNFEDFYNARLAISMLAMSWEVLDERENRYVFHRLEDFKNDLNNIRRRIDELKDAPLVSDCYRFPSRPYINELLSFNRDYKQHLQFQQISTTNMLKWWCYEDAIQETEYFYQIWDTTRDAQSFYYYITVRRAALLRLKKALGDKDYYAGNLPPHVPINYFTWTNK